MRFHILVVSGKVSLIKVIFFFGRSIVLTKVCLCANFYFKVPTGYVLYLICFTPICIYPYLSPYFFFLVCVKFDTRFEFHDFF
jgi:hypothetical protein